MTLLFLQNIKLRTMYIKKPSVTFNIKAIAELKINYVSDKFDTKVTVLIAFQTYH